MALTNPAAEEQVQGSLCLPETPARRDTKRPRACALPGREEGARARGGPRCAPVRSRQRPAGLPGRGRARWPVATRPPTPQTLLRGQVTSPSGSCACVHRPSARGVWGLAWRTRGHGSVTKEKAVQSVRPKIADGLQKVFIFVERKQ